MRQINDSTDVYKTDTSGEINSTSLGNSSVKLDDGEKLISDRIDEFLAFLCTPIMRMLPQEYIDCIVDDIAGYMDNTVRTAANMYNDS